MSFWSKIFGRKKEKTPEETFAELKLGDLVSVEYRHPKEIGIVTGESLTYTRLNHEEIDNRKIRGTISSIRNKDLPLKMMVVEVSTYESPAMPGTLRRFLFLAEEISKIKRIE